MHCTQTGPAGSVKALGVAFALLLLAGCAGGWVNSNRTAAEVKADERACNQEAEENTMLKSGRQPVDYIPPGLSPPGGSMGKSPRELYDQSKSTRNFHDDYDACMESKGYTHGRSTDG